MKQKLNKLLFIFGIIIFGSIVPTAAKADTIFLFSGSNGSVYLADVNIGPKEGTASDPYYPGETITSTGNVYCSGCSSSQGLHNASPHILTAIFGADVDNGGLYSEYVELYSTLHTDSANYAVPTIGNYNMYFSVTYTTESNDHPTRTYYIPFAVTYAPTVTVTARPAIVPYNGGTTIHWDSENASYCNPPSGYESAGTGVSGDFNVKNITSTRTFSVECKGKAAVTTVGKPTVDLSYESIQSDASFSPYESRKVLTAMVTNADYCSWDKKTQIIQGVSGGVTETVDIEMPGYPQYKSNGPSSYTTIISSVAHYVTPTTTYSMTCSNGAGSTTGSTNINWYTYQGYQYPYAGAYPTSLGQTATVPSCVPGTSGCSSSGNSYKFNSGTSGISSPVYVSTPSSCIGIQEINLSYLGLACPSVNMSGNNIPYFPTCGDSKLMCRFYN